MKYIITFLFLNFFINVSFAQNGIVEKLLSAARNIGSSDSVLFYRIVEEAFRRDTANLETRFALVNGYVNIANDSVIVSNMRFCSYLSFSPDSKNFAVACKNGVASVYTLSGERVVTVRHKDVVNSVVFSPDNKYLLTASFDLTAKSWEWSGDWFSVFTEHRGDVVEAKFSPDCQTIATACADGKVRLWNVYAQNKREFLAHEKGVNCLSFTPKTANLLTAGNDSCAKIFNLEGVVLQKFKHEEAVISANISSNEELLLTVTKGGNVYLWETKTMQKVFNQSIGSSVLFATFSPNGSFFATAGSDSTTRIFSCAGKELLLLKHQDKVLHLAFSPDDKYLITASKDDKVRLWILNPNEILQIINEKKLHGNIPLLSRRERRRLGI